MMPSYFFFLLCNLPSVRAIPESGVADVRVKWSNHTNPYVTGLKYGCTYTPENTVIICRFLVL